MLQEKTRPNSLPGTDTRSRFLRTDLDHHRPLRPPAGKKTNIVEHPEEISPKSPRFVEVVMTFIMEQPLKDLVVLSINNLTEHFDVSRSSLNNRFNQEIGISPGKAIVREKMMRAATLLEVRTEFQICQVARKLDYCNCDYFIRVFKEYFGVTPLKYRELRKDLLE